MKRTRALPRFPRKGTKRHSITIERRKPRIGSTCRVNGFSWTRESRNGSFNRTISGQSVVSAVISALPGGVYVPSSHRGCRSSRSLGLLRCGAQVTARSSPRPTPSGILNGRAASFPAPTGDAGEEEKARQRPRMLLGPTLSLAGPPIPLRGADLSTYGKQDLLEGSNSLTRRWNAKCFTGAGGVIRLQSLVIRLSKTDRRSQRPSATSPHRQPFG